MFLRFRNGEYNFVLGGFADNFGCDLRRSHNRLRRGRFDLNGGNRFRCNRFNWRSGSRCLYDWLNRGYCRWLRSLVPFANTKLCQNGFNGRQRLARFCWNSRNQRLRRHDCRIDVATFPESEV